MSRACPHGGSRSWCESCLNEDLAQANRDKAEMLALLERATDALRGCNFSIMATAQMDTWLDDVNTLLQRLGE